MIRRRPEIPYRVLARIVGLHQCTCSFGVGEKVPCGLRFFGAFLCGFAVFGPPITPPSSITIQDSVTLAYSQSWPHSNDNDSVAAS